MIAEVPMYQARCDVCSAYNNNSEYWAWADKDQALDDWRESDMGITLDDGRMFCFGCIPADVCRFSDGDGQHSPGDDGKTCDECDAALVGRMATEAAK